MAATLQSETKPDFAQDSRYPVVYAVRVHRLGAIKIGHTQNLFARLSTLKTTYLSDVEILGVLPGSRADEARIHDRLANSLFPETPNSKELFSPTSEVMAFISREMTPPAEAYHNYNPYFSRYQPRFALTRTFIDGQCSKALEMERELGAETGRLYKRILVHEIKQKHTQGLDVSLAVQIVKEQLGIDIELRPRPAHMPEQTRRTLEETEFTCRIILEAPSGIHSDWAMRRLQNLTNWLRKDAANGFDVSEAIRIVKERLGIEISLDDVRRAG